MEKGNSLWLAQPLNRLCPAASITQAAIKAEFQRNKPDMGLAGEAGALLCAAN